jgi:hypothetical protein
MTRRLVNSFSFGETSAYMTYRNLCDPATYRRYDDVITIVANTTRERAEALEFGRRCDTELGFNSVWVEAVAYPGEAKASGHRVVTHETARTDGSAFEDMIRKYGIPNYQYIHCTRELKLNAIRSYVENELGWARGTYDTAVGIRADEIDRMSETAMANGVIYPLARLGVTKPHINEWWAKQPFRLNLKGYQGNCRGCFKKSWRKIFTLIQEDASEFDWNRDMEAKYGLVGGEFSKEPGPGQEPLAADYRRVFYRENRSTNDVLALYEQVKGQFVPAEDDSLGSMTRDSDGTRRAETAWARGPKPCQARAEGIAQVCDDLFTQQFNRWSHLLKAGEQAKQFNRETGASNKPPVSNSR